VFAQESHQLNLTTVNRTAVDYTGLLAISASSLAKAMLNLILSCLTLYTRTYLH